MLVDLKIMDQGISMSSFLLNVKSLYSDL